MFSNFGNINPIKARQAENADARFGLRRHDPDERRPKKDDDADSPLHFDEDDSATVSVEALQMFLQNFLKSATESSREAAKPAEGKPNFARPNIPQQPRRPVSGVAAQAMSAYQHSAQTARGGALEIHESDKAQSVAESLGLSSGEIRTIETLLVDLKALTQRGIGHVRIERGETFLDSLSAAVNKVK